MGIYVNGAEVAATSGHSQSETISPHLSGDSYTFKIENGESNRIAKLYRQRNNIPALLWTNTVPVTSYPMLSA